MSPRGDADSAEPSGDVGRFGSLPSRRRSDAPDDPLPLRLSIARGGLGIELARSIQVGPVVCEQLDVHLPGVNYPIDLSKGVKQFKGRRSELREITLNIVLEEIAAAWAPSIREVWGETPNVRLALSAGSKAVSPRSVGSEVARVLAPANENSAVGAISVCVFSDRGALAFDLVVTSGDEPRLVIDVARSEGKLKFLASRPATEAALQIVVAGLATSPLGVELVRRGRSVIVQGLARALCLEIFPKLGFRMPAVGKCTIVEASGTLGALRCRIADAVEPFPADLRAIRLATLTEFLVEADEHLLAGERALARQCFLRALDMVPGQTEVSCEIAELDLTEDRAESAIVFLEECDDSGGSRRSLLLARALEKTGRDSAATEMWAQAAQREPEHLFSAYLFCALAAREPDPVRKREILDAAVAKSPLLAVTRRERLSHCLVQGDKRTALIDVEQLEALQMTLDERALLLGDFAARFARAGWEDEAVRLLRRSLRFTPDHPALLIQLGEHLFEASENLRAAELLTAALKRLTSIEHDDLHPAEREALEVQSHHCRFLLARILMMDASTRTEALIHLGAIPTRSRPGAEARLLEAEIFHKRANFRERDHAVARWIEAAQLGWISIGDSAPRVAEAVSTFQPPLEPAVAAAVRAIIEHLS